MSGAGFIVTGLTVGQTYTGVIPFWAEPGSPNVAATAAQTTGPTVSVKGADAVARVVFVATSTFHTLRLEAVPGTYGVPVYVQGFGVFAGNYTGPYAEGAVYAPNPIAVYDHEALQGGPADYILADADGSTLATTRVELPTWGTWLKSPGRPHRNTRVYLENAGTVTRKARRQVVPIEDSPTSVVLSQARADPEGAIRLLALQGPNAAAVDLLLDDGSTLLLDTDPAWSVPFRYISVGDAEEYRPHEGTLGLDRPARGFALAQVVTVDAPVGLTVVDPSRTYDQLPVLFGSYIAIAATVPTYEALATGEA